MYQLLKNRSKLVLRSRIGCSFHFPASESFHDGRKISFLCHWGLFIHMKIQYFQGRPCSPDGRKAIALTYLVFEVDVKPLTSVPESVLCLEEENFISTRQTSTTQYSPQTQQSQQPSDRGIQVDHCLSRFTICQFSSLDVCQLLCGLLDKPTVVCITRCFSNGNFKSES